MRTSHSAKVTLATVALALIPIAALAGPFDGTWKISLAHVTLSKKLISYQLAGGEFTCSTCGPAYTVKADGSDQPVKGHDYDTVAVTASGGTVTSTLKLQGKVLATIKMMVSGDSLARETTDLTGSQPMVQKTTLTRVNGGPAGSDPVSGSWRMTKVESISGDGASDTYGLTEDGFTLSSNGQSFDAKFDGKKYPIVGDPTHMEVAVKKLGPSEVEERDYQHGKLVEIIRRSVSANGKSMDVTTEAVRTGRTTHYTRDKVS